MQTILPQYIVSPDLTDTTDMATLLYSSVSTDPTTGLYSATAEYTTGDTVYYLDEAGPHKGCYVEYEALQDMTGSDVGKDPYSEIAYWV